jgi:hypothetical protein
VTAPGAAGVICPSTIDYRSETASTITLTVVSKPRAQKLELSDQTQTSLWRKAIAWEKRQVANSTPKEGRTWTATRQTAKFS